ncbi:MAG: hypothetical protein ACT4NY_00695 [Pseudonocardiales bacterium]
MRFPNPTAVTCLTCGQPTVIAETALGSMRVHCGTWRTQCDTKDVVPKRDPRYSTSSAALDADTDQDQAA